MHVTVAVLMDPQVIAGSMLGLAALFATGAYGYNRYERAKRRRARNVAAISIYLQRCWRIIENLPPVFLPPSLRGIMCKLMHNRIDLAVGLDPNNEYIAQQRERLHAYEATADRGMGLSTKPNLRPSERKQSSQLLRDVKLVLRNALTARVINKDEYVEGRMVADALLLRILVDHLKSNAQNAEKLGHNVEATAYLQRARTELLNADKALYAEEVADIDSELARLHRLADPEHDKRRASPRGKNTLLEAWEAEAEAEDGDHAWQRSTAYD